MIQKILKVGSSAMVMIPERMLKELGLRIGDQVVVEVDKVSKMVLVQPIVLVKK